MADPCNGCKDPGTCVELGYCAIEGYSLELTAAELLAETGDLGEEASLLSAGDYYHRDKAKAAKAKRRRGK